MAFIPTVSSHSSALRCVRGGLAETAGDPYPHLSSKSLGSWKIERWFVHSVLVFVIATTALLRWYAQRGQNIIRSSCVGCGICSAVCPRGVLNLENGPREGRFGTPHLNLIGDLEILEDQGISDL